MSRVAPQLWSSRHRRAFTLIEMLAVLPAVGLIAGIIGAALILVARSATPPDDARAIDTWSAARRVASDLTAALSFSQSSAQVVEFRVPDRTGNGRDDTLRYSWSGTAGDPLLFTLNKQPAVSILDDVQSLQFTPETTSDALGPLDEELAVIFHHDHAPESHTHDYSLESEDMCGQCFTPDLPLGTTSWTIKRVRFMAKRDGDDLDGVIGVRIESGTIGPQPTGIVLEKSTIAETSLDEESGWVDVDFTALNDLDPMALYCIVLEHAGGSGQSAKVVYEHGGDPMTSGTHWLTSSDGGAFWSGPVTDKDMRFYILGTYDMWVPTARQYVVGMHLEMQAGSTSPTTVGLMATVLNPVELGP